MSKSVTQIRPRKLPDISADENKAYWLNNDAFKTHFMNALSITFPIGEKFFVQSVHPFRDQVSDPQLKEDIRRFIHQEANHRQAHKHFNQSNISNTQLWHRLRDGFQKKTNINQRINSRLNLLAQTVALEHITAIFAHYLLTEHSWREGVDDISATIWIWHAIEEIEHKAVAFDTYQSVGGGYCRRTSMMALVSLLFFVDVLWMTGRLLHADKKLFRLATIKSAWRFLFGKRGMIRKCFTHYLAYFKFRFHPWDIDDQRLISHFDQFEKI
ncbi:metal-dependent hydrolase [Pleionea sediminis]|uniref:metal-dependent hydrolase n=1 Tax=Pleionea sediminis TaxID=2569479 RepID=UPI001184D7E6|nr:metal-dependent hydrolase [Pleionea sediminis]